LIFILDRNELAQELAANMKKRQKELQMENSTLVTALFLDPRFKSHLSTVNRNRAKEHIKHVIGRIRSMQEGKSSVPAPSRKK